ncbi:DUF885 domain-containing protein [Sphingomonas flavalba]|uniref:DUF885 domain-containing protein n=1 Tax=Sphingomonas flavalba TaxID=2559804 RepID=UPI00109DF483|nr:DUF885 family protein [Sphingomonas flavalba]
MIDRRHFLATTAAAAFLPLAQPLLAAAGGAEGAKARALYDRIFEGQMLADPATATALGLDSGARAGLKSKLADAAFDNRLGGSQAMVDALPALKAVDRAALGGRDPYYLDTAIWAAERAGEVKTFDYGGLDGYPVPYVLSQLTGAYQAVPDFLDSQHRIETRADCDAYLARLEDFAKVIGQQSSRAEADAAKGVIPPDFILDKTVAQTEALRGQSGETSGLAASLGRRAAEKRLGNDWAARAAKIVDGPIAAALDRQLAVLAALRPRAGTAPAASRLPDGERFYALALRTHITTTHSPEEAHRIGLGQVAAITAEVDALLKAQGRGTGSVGERLVALNADPTQLFANDDKGRADLIAYLNGVMAAARAGMQPYFNKPPAAAMDIRRVPPAIELGAPRGYASPGSLDGSRPGAFYINLHDVHDWPKYTLPTLVYHEAVPGHLWHGAILQETKDLPLLHQNLYFSAFTEGWALYGEQLAAETGLYDGNPFGKVGWQQSFLYRAARIVLDTGIHAKGWSRDKAIAYMIETVGLTRSAVENEVDRYCVWPGQACGYKMGHTEIARLREVSKQVLGQRFDLKGWHDAVLLGGSMPLEVLGQVIADWDAMQRG